MQHSFAFKNVLQNVGYCVFNKCRTALRGREVAIAWLYATEGWSAQQYGTWFLKNGSRTCLLWLEIISSPSLKFVFVHLWNKFSSFSQHKEASVSTGVDTLSTIVIFYLRCLINLQVQRSSARYCKQPELALAYCSYYLIPPFRNGKEGWTTM